MNNTRELVDRHPAIWNEPDADRRRKAFRELWSENAVHILQPPKRFSAAMTSARTAATAAATATLGLAAASWVVAVRQMNGMDMGVATGLGSFAFFVGLSVAMMAAMMLPGAAAAASRRARASGRVRAVPLFVGSYIAVWTLVGVAVYALYRPHGSVAAGAVAIAAGVYEFPPPKQHLRRRRPGSVRSGFPFRPYCVGSGIWVS